MIPLRRDLTRTPLRVSFFYMLFVAKFNIESASGLGGGDVNAGPQQVVPGWLSSGVVNEDDG
jgi:hypothetical protein